MGHSNDRAKLSFIPTSLFSMTVRTEAYLFTTVLPTVADHNATNGMVCQIRNKNLVVK